MECRHDARIPIFICIRYLGRRHWMNNWHQADRQVGEEIDSFALTMMCLY
uniref:Transposase n=1 Tax=Echinococcus granulosus TaxID=6210 RepID=A0A068X299_ECHGR|nr:hypothetical protein EgrG_001202200 [Echinococcus granulosus]